MTTLLLKSPDPKTSLTEEKLSFLVRSNISCHFNKPLSSDLIKVLTQQIVESINLFYIQGAKADTFKKV